MVYEDATGIAVPRFDGRISHIKSSFQASGGTVSSDNAYIYDMMGNMTRKLGTGALGRENAGGGREWYVKDYQGSLVMTVVNDAVGNVIAYEPYGAQKLLQADGDLPSEQYTGKEYDGRLGLTYFGARYFDPSFALWLTPDPAGQYLNPYSYGGDPVNAVDFDGRWSWKTALGLGVAELLTLGLVSEVAGAMAFSPTNLKALGLYIGGELSKHGGDFGEWDWERIGNTTATNTVTGLLGGPEGAASLITPVSIVTRCFYADDCGGVIGDAFTGGFAIDNLGHKLGLYNAMLLGGTADWYQGNMVYSGGIMDRINGGGEFFGHALYVHNRDNKSTIAHEIDHVQQMETRGARIMTIIEYMVDNSWDPSYNSPTYYRNPREMDAYYRGFLYDLGCVDVYGERQACLGMEKDEWTHEQLSDMFYNGYGHKDETEKFVWDHVGYKYYDGVGAAYREHWTWHEGWWLETGFGVFSRWGHGWSW